MSKKILAIFGTRPEAIKFFPVVRALAEVPGLTVRTCVTAQHRDLLDQVLEIAGLKPDIDLDLMEPGQSLDRLTAPSRSDTTSGLLCSPMMVMQWVRSRGWPRPVT